MVKFPNLILNERHLEELEKILKKLTGELGDDETTALTMIANIKAYGYESAISRMMSNYKKPNYLHYSGACLAYFIDASTPKTIEEYINMMELSVNKDNKEIRLNSDDEKKTKTTDTIKTLLSEFKDDIDEFRPHIYKHLNTYTSKLGIDVSTELNDGIERSSDVFGKKSKFRLRDEIKNFMLENKEEIDKLMEESKDFIYMNYRAMTVFSFIGSYLSRDSFNGPIIENIRQLYIRVCTEIVLDTPDPMVFFKELYHGFIHRMFIVATPTLINAGFKDPNLASCFLQKTPDSMEGICKTIGDGMKISKAKGGVGVCLADLRTHTPIGDSGFAKGAIPYAKLSDTSATYADQTGKRKGAYTGYIDIAHYDVVEFIKIVRKTGNNNVRVEQLNNAINISNFFVKRVLDDGNWTMFCPTTTPGLTEAVGKEYAFLYQMYEADSSIEPRITMKARDIMDLITKVQIETGMPYLLNKCEYNIASPQVNMKSKLNPEDSMHADTIKCSNLCTEIVQYAGPRKYLMKHENMTEEEATEVSTCNLGQMNLSYYVNKETKRFDFELFAINVRKMVKCLNKVIDRSWFPIKSAFLSNRWHRPIGLGVSGFAECLMDMELCVDDDEAIIFNKKLFACMYFNCLVSSHLEAKENGSYKAFKGSRYSEGKLQMDLFEESTKVRQDMVICIDYGPENIDDNGNYKHFNYEPYQWDQENYPDGICNWQGLKDAIQYKGGLRNSLLIALMPTSSTSRLMDVTEMVEIPQCNAYSRKIMGDTFIWFNERMYKKLKEYHLWNDKVAELMILDSGSIRLLPQFVKDHPSMFPQDVDMKVVERMTKIFMSAWEQKLSKAVELTAGRVPYICQSQSSNLFIADPTPEKLMLCHLKSAMSGIKTLNYYIRMLPAMPPSEGIISLSVREWAYRYMDGRGGRTVPKLDMENLSQIQGNKKEISLECNGSLVRQVSSTSTNSLSSLFSLTAL